MTVVGESYYEGAYGVDGIAENSLALDIPSSLVVSLFVIVYISRLKLFIIAYKVLIVTNNSTIAT